MDDITDFLPCETPDAWVHHALDNLDTLLIDHANCEKKAAATAMNLMYRHVENSQLLLIMSRLAREELLHFQQVVTLLKERGITYTRLGPSRYASGLRQHIDSRVSNGLIDTLIIGAFVEARSCERFARLVPWLDDELSRFYRNLIKSEARHFGEYLELARVNASGDIADRIEFYSAIEKDLILGPDEQFRFHSGMPASE
ncbi:MAG: tRNA-(ms[2]io[6]A)-hydroxylase [Gammaproteobacteria bacterium]|nr:tRNA-(ms[2]io[6]A)-hydroxylase [Gammaproteobacteria bacterium]